MAEDKAKSIKETRVPLHKQNDRQIYAREGFERRQVLRDVPGRVDKFLLAGWVVVMKEDGSGPVEFIVNKDPTAVSKIAVLMEIPLDIYLKDKAEQLALIDEKERSFDGRLIAGTERHGMYGNVNINGREKRI